MVDMPTRRLLINSMNLKSRPVPVSWEDGTKRVGYWRRMEVAGERFFADAGYDAEQLYETCYKRGLQPLIKMRCSTANPKKYRRKAWNTFDHELFRKIRDYAGMTPLDDSVSKEQSTSGMKHAGIRRNDGFLIKTTFEQFPCPRYLQIRHFQCLSGFEIIRSILS